MKLLKEYIRFLLEKCEHDPAEDDKDDDLLIEPDYTEERDEKESQEEMSAVSGGGGGLAPSGQMSGHTGGKSKGQGKDRFGKRNYANFKKKK